MESSLFNKKESSLIIDKIHFIPLLFRDISHRFLQNHSNSIDSNVNLSKSFLSAIKNWLNNTRFCKISLNNKRFSSSLLNIRSNLMSTCFRWFAIVMDNNSCSSWLSKLSCNKSTKILSSSSNNNNFSWKSMWCHIFYLL